MAEINNRIDKELREKAKLTDAEISLTIQFDPSIKVGAEYQELKHRAIADRATDKALALLQQKCNECEYDPQAAEFGWFLEHGWTPPAELEKKIEEARRQIISYIEKNCKGYEDRTVGTLLDSMFWRTLKEK